MGGRGGTGGKRSNSSTNKEIRDMVDKINNLSNNLEDIEGFDYESDVYRPDLQEAYALNELKVNPIPMFSWEKDYETFEKAQQLTATPEKFDNLKQTEVPVSKLTSIQGVVDARALRNKIQSGGVEKAVNSLGYANDAVQIAKIGNSYIVINGNHRAAIAKLSGKKTIKAQVLNLK